MKLSAADVGKAKAVEGKDNVLDMQGCWDEVGFEDDHASIIPFAKAKANILIAVGSDDKIGHCDRQVCFSSHRCPNYCLMISVILWGLYIFFLYLDRIRQISCGTRRKEEL